MWLAATCGVGECRTESRNTLPEGRFVTDFSSREHSVSPVRSVMRSALVCAGLWTATVPSPDVLTYENAFNKVLS